MILNVSLVMHEDGSMNEQVPVNITAKANRLLKLVSKIVKDLRELEYPIQNRRPYAQRWTFRTQQARVVEPYPSHYNGSLTHGATSETSF